MSFICNGSPEYGWCDKVKKLEPHVFRQWLNKAVSLRKHLDSKDVGREAGDVTSATVNQANFPRLYCSDGLLMDAEEMEAWNEAGVDITVKRVKGLASNARELQQTIFQVSIAGIGLMQIQCVDLLEDCCTNELQNWLDRGWRILAVCPPHDTRRPSYVLGHVDKEPHR